MYTYAALSQTTRGEEKKGKERKKYKYIYINIYIKKEHGNAVFVDSFCTTLVTPPLVLRGILVTR